jgi:hypothetical protein
MPITFWATYNRKKVAAKTEKKRISEIFVRKNENENLMPQYHAKSLEKYFHIICKNECNFTEIYRKTGLNCVFGRQHTYTYTATAEKIKTKICFYFIPTEA